MDVVPQCNVAVMGDMIDFSSSGIDAQGYLAVPENGSGPGVIVVQEWWGLVPHIKEVADLLSAYGEHGQGAAGWLSVRFLRGFRAMPAGLELSCLRRAMMYSLADDVATNISTCMRLNERCLIPES